MVEASQHQNGSERESRLMLGLQTSHCYDQTNSSVVDSSEGVGRKGRMSNTTDRYRAGLLDGHGNWQIRRLQFQGVTRHPFDKTHALFARQPRTVKAVKRWVGEGGKVTLVGWPDADTLREAIEELRKRTTAGAATFLVKVNAHRGEPAEEADMQVDKAI